MTESTNTSWSQLSVTADSQEIIRVARDELAEESLPFESRPVYQTSLPALTLTVREDERAVRSFVVPTSQLERAGEPPWFFHFSVQILSHLFVMIDCMIRHTESPPSDDWKENLGLQGVRFLPFLLSGSDHTNEELRGYGLFTRRIHFAGIVTPTNICACCVCDYCGKSFVLNHFHAGFSDVQYFYCEKGVHTLSVSEPIEGMPFQLEGPKSGLDFEKELPACQECGTAFRYYNPRRCPHCGEPFIDFAKYPHMRPSEYYGYYGLGQKIQYPDQTPK